MDQLGIPLKGGAHELKIGSSFSSKKATSDSPAFHAFRYDFKPVSIDTSKPSTVSVGERNEVNVVMPNVEGSAQPMTHFKGPKRESKKQCVLIVNHDTGEITLERLSHDVVLKRQRLDGTSKAYVKTPIPPTASTSSTSVEKGATSSSSANVSQSGARESGSTSGNDMGPALPSSSGTSMSQLKKTLKKKKKSKQPCSAATVPDDDEVSPKPTQQPNPPAPPLKPPSKPPPNNTLQPPPPSASIPSSASISESLSLPEAKNNPNKASPVGRLSSSSSSSSSSDDSSGPDSDNEDSKSSSTRGIKASPPPPGPSVAAASRPVPTATTLTVSDYKSLQDDLCLSESGSDSD